MFLVVEISVLYANQGYKPDLNDLLMTFSLQLRCLKYKAKKRLNDKNNLYLSYHFM